MLKNRTIGVGGVLFMLTASAGWAAADEFYATVQKIENGKVTFAKKEVGKGAKGKGGKKGGSMTTVPAASDIYVTTATYVRRTANFRIGIPLGGGLKNSAIKSLQPGSLARIVTDGDHIVEMNVVIDDSDGTTIVAIPPKRPATTPEK